MANESMSHAEKNQEEELSAPPGSGSPTTFTLKRVEITDIPSRHVSSENPSEPEISSVPPLFEIDDFATTMRSLNYKQRPWIVYDQSENGREHDVKQHDMISSRKAHLPKGVTRGCSDCSGCQKVFARWKPTEACTYVLKDAIVFYPNEEDFKDTFKYIDSIRHEVEPYGVCRIVPPSSWRLPSFLEGDDIWQQYKFPTRVQKVHDLQNHGSYRNLLIETDSRAAKQRKLDSEFGDASAANFVSDERHGTEGFQTESGPEFSLIAFKRYADYFQQNYFSREVHVANNRTVNQEQREPTEHDIEGEYWRIVDKPTEEIEVLCGTKTLCKKLDDSSNSQQALDLIKGSDPNWNLKCLYKLPGSLLSFDALDSSSILEPQLHVGMCFSCLPWTVEEHKLYKLQYLHLGAPRIWYGTPGADCHNIETIIKKYFPVSDEEHVEPLHRHGRQLSPETIEAEGIPVYRCIQRPGEFVLFLPGAYHSGFDCGFNCSMSSVLAPLDWLPHGQISVELYREKRRKTLFSHDKVLLRAADEAVKARWENLLRGKKSSEVLMWKEASGKDNVLAKTLRARIKSETRCRDYLSSMSQSRKMDKSFNVDRLKLECSICCYDLYLSAASCSCNPYKYACLVHAKHLCSCPWVEKLFYFRYQISELIVLADAVGCKLSAIRSWIKDNLGLALQWGDKPNQEQNDPCLHLASASDKVKDTFQENHASDPTLFSEAQQSLLGNSNDSKAEATDNNIEDTADDTRSSSSSDFDVEEYISNLERTCKSGALNPVWNEGESMPDEQNTI